MMNSLKYKVRFGVSLSTQTTLVQPVIVFNGLILVLHSPRGIISILDIMGLENNVSSGIGVGDSGW
jgi:hypothetical protein